MLYTFEGLASKMAVCQLGMLQSNGASLGHGSPSPAFRLLDFALIGKIESAGRLEQILQLFSAYSSVFQDLLESSSGYFLAAMIRNCDSLLGFWVGEDIMATRNSFQ